MSNKQIKESKAKAAGAIFDEDPVEPDVGAVEPDEIPLVVNEMWRWAGKIVTVRAVKVDEGEVRVTVAWQDRFENMPKSVTLPESRFRVEAEPYSR